MKENRDTLRWLYRQTKPLHGKICLQIILNILISFGSVLFALLTKRLIDSSVILNSGKLVQYSILLAVVVLAQYSFSAASNYLIEDTAVQSMTFFRSKLMQCILGKEYAMVSRKHSGEWMNLMFSDVKIVSEGYASILPSFAGMLSRLLGSAAALMFLEPVFGAAYLGAGALILLFVTLLRGRLKQLHRDVQKKEDSLHSAFQELTENQMIVRAFSAEEYFCAKADQEQDIYKDARMHRRVWRVLSRFVFSLAFRLGYVAALIWGGYRLLEGTASFGTLTAMLQLIGQIQSPISGLSGMLPRIYEVIASAERIREPEGWPEENESREDPDEFDCLTMDHVSFSYDRDTVLDDVSLILKKGDTAALTGISGGGKSTLFLLLLGLFQPEHGTIHIQCADGTHQPSGTLRKLFAYVPQGNGLMKGTIAENVCFGLPYDEKKLKDALHIAEAEDFVMSLPESVHTQLAERGKGLSEGQIQRLAITRAVYSGRKVLLLDECTSALDTETEQRVLRNISTLKDRTILLVTHRPSALRICSRQFILENGKLREL